MKKEWVLVLKKSLLMMGFMTLLCGVIYPCLITGISQIFFRDKANGSLIEVDSKIYGSKLLAQEFTGNNYLWGRVMVHNMGAFQDEEGNALFYAGPSNISPASEEYGTMIQERVKKMQEANSNSGMSSIPVDLVTGSGSGLDPHISVKAAEYQAARIADERNIPRSDVENIIDKYTSKKLFGIFGEETVHVLQVNLALDSIIK